jgi:hypothetical protein
MQQKQQQQQQQQQQQGHFVARSWQANALTMLQLLSHKLRLSRAVAPACYICVNFTHSSASLRSCNSLHMSCFLLTLLLALALIAACGASNSPSCTSTSSSRNRSSASVMCWRSAACLCCCSLPCRYYCSLLVGAGGAAACCCCCCFPALALSSLLCLFLQCSACNKEIAMIK